MNINIKKYKGLGFLIFISFFLSGCVSAPKLKQAHEIVPPEPIYGNSGKFMSPYTEDDVLADWVDKAVNAKAGAQIGAAVGAYAGAKALEMVPFIGGMIGKYAGEQIGRQIAISASGGMEYITSSSDLSFNSLNEMSVYLYAKFSTHAHYQDALAATMEIYPDLKKIYQPAIYKASAEAPDAAQVAKIRQRQEQLHQQEIDEQEDTETVTATVRTLQTDGSVIETKSTQQAEPQSSPQAQETSSVTVDAIEVKQNIEPVELQSEQQVNAVDVSQKLESGKGTIIKESVVVEPSSEKEKIDIETKEDVSEAVNRSEHAGSYGSTTSKITTITTVKTVTTPGKKTIIYREIRK